MRGKLLYNNMIVSFYQYNRIQKVLFHGLPHRYLHMAIHGFVWKNLQNRLMSTICKSPIALASLHSFIMTDSD
jgi:hypothetical protein